MRRALTAALTLALLIPAGATAQDESEWPTAYEVRRELQSIGYQFGYNGVGWDGARDPETGYSVDMADAIIVEGPDRQAVIWTTVEQGAALSLPESLDSGYTATMEVLSMLPGGGHGSHDLLDTLFYAFQDCYVLELGDHGVLQASRASTVDDWLVLFLPAGPTDPWFCEDPKPIQSIRGDNAE